MKRITPRTTPLEAARILAEAHGASALRIAERRRDNSRTGARREFYSRVFRILRTEGNLKLVMRRERLRPPGRRGL